MQEWEQPCRHYGEDSHCLGTTINCSPPRCSGQVEDSRDQCSCVADTDPENEVSDVETPGDGMADSTIPNPNIDLYR